MRTVPIFVFVLIRYTYDHYYYYLHMCGVLWKRHANATHTHTHARTTPVIKETCGVVTSYAAGTLFSLSLSLSHYDECVCFVFPSVEAAIR
jgi:hypothetical protein